LGPAGFFLEKLLKFFSGELITNYLMIQGVYPGRGRSIGPQKITGKNPGQIRLVFKRTGDTIFQ